MSQPVDDRILELLAETGLRLPTSAVAENIDYSRGYVSTRLTTLAERELVARNGERGYYEITDRGTAYLEGELDAGDLSDS